LLRLPKGGVHVPIFPTLRPALDVVVFSIFQDLEYIAIINLLDSGRNWGCGGISAAAGQITPIDGLLDAKGPALLPGLSYC
jgi:hypothetical protein